MNLPSTLVARYSVAATASQLRQIFILAFLAAGVALLAMPSSAAESSKGPISSSFVGKTAIGGRDTVAYHSSESISAHKDTKGTKKWVHEWRGAKWRFASEESYQKFKADPERYRPAYGGYCSNALSLGEGLISTNGTHWEIFGDRLHLFFAARGRDRWLDGNYEKYNAEAAQAWKEITGYDDL